MHISNIPSLNSDLATLYGAPLNEIQRLVRRCPTATTDDHLRLVVEISSFVWPVAPMRLVALVRNFPRLLRLGFAPAVARWTATLGAEHAPAIPAMLIETPSMVALRPDRALARMISVYGPDTQNACVRAIIASRGKFVTYDHAARIDAAVAVYGEVRRQDIRRMFLASPAAAGRDHSRLLARLLDSFGGQSKERVIRAVFRSPTLISLDPRRVLRHVTDVYGKQNRDRLKHVILSNPSFANFKHDRVLAEARAVYGEMAVALMLAYPPFAGLDHARRVSRAASVWSVPETAVVRAICTYPHLVGYNPANTLTKLVDVYGATNKRRIISAILSAPRFVSYDHAAAYTDAVALYGEAEGLAYKAKALANPWMVTYRFPRWRRLVKNVNAA